MIYRRPIAWTVLLFVCVGVCVGQRSSSSSRKRVVDRFLVTLFVKKDIPATVKFFDQRAFSDRYVYGCSCCETDNLDENERDPNVIRKGLADFLSEVREVPPVKDFKKMLTLKSNLDSETGLIATVRRKGTLNNPKRDRYYLASYSIFSSKEEQDDPDFKAFQRKYNLLNAFYSIVLFYDPEAVKQNSYTPEMLVLWVKSGSGWKAASITVGPCV